METIKQGRFFENETQDINDVEKALSSVNIDLRDGSRNFREMQDVIEEIGSHWGEWDDVTKALVSNAIAGNRQANMFNILMQQWPKTAQALNKEIEATGTTLDRYQSQLESIEASENKMKSTWEGIWQTILNSDAIKFMYDFATTAGEGFQKVLDLDNSLRGLATAGPFNIIVSVGYQVIASKIEEIEFGGAKGSVLESKKIEKEIAIVNNAFKDGLMTIDDYDNSIKKLNDRLLELNRFDFASDKMKVMAEATKKSGDQIKEFSNDYASAMAEVKSAKGDLQEQISSINSIGSSLEDIVENYEKYGQLGLDQIATLQEAFPEEYTNALYEENGQIKLNVEALHQLMLAKMDEAIATAQLAYEKYTSSIPAIDAESTALLNQLNILKALRSQFISTPTKVSIPTYSGRVSSSGENQYLKDYNDILKATIGLIKQRKEEEKEALKDELDGYKRIIDAKKEEIDLSHQQQEYEDKLAEKNKEIADIDNELLELQFDNSEYAKRRRLELENEKSKKIIEINKYQEDQNVENQKNALDKEYDAFEEIQEQKIDVIEDYLDQSGQLTQDALDLLKNHAGETYDALISWNRLYGTGIDEDISKKWANALTAIETGLYKIKTSSSSAFGGMTNSINTAIDAVNSLTSKLSNQQRQWNAIVNYDVSPSEVHHDGANSGFVGGLPTLQSNEVFAKLLTGELVVNQNQMSTFVNKTLPSLVTSGGNMGNIAIEMIVNVAGNLDKTVLPSLEQNVANQMTQIFRNIGIKTNVNAYGV